MNVEDSLFLIVFDLDDKILHIASTLISSITQIVSQLVQVTPIIVDSIRILMILLFL